MIARLCKPEDKATWVALNRDFMEEELGDNEFWASTVEISTKKLEEAFDKAMEKPGDVFLMLFEHEDKVLGFSNLVRFFSVWANGDALIVDDFFICDEYRHMGIGKDGVKIVENFAEKHKFNRIQFHSNHEDERTYEFFNAIGFNPTDMKFYVRHF
ncbi:MAG: GNAT family N-acetyltransferase [Anaerovoracaceae bacterium]